MADDASFLRAVIENPDDDGPRLIYADWLEENARGERAEFIRLQCRLDTLRQSHAAAPPELAAREQALRRRFEADWPSRIPVLSASLTVTFQRGFVEDVRAEARSFVAGAEELFRAAPVRRVALYWGMDPPHERARFMQVVASLPDLARLRALELEDSFIGSDGMQALAVSEYLTNLEWLGLRGGHVGERGVRAMVAAPWFANLRYLDLSQNDINAGATHALAVAVDELNRAGRLRLREIALEGNPLRQAVTRVLRSWPVLGRLVRP